MPIPPAPARQAPRSPAPTGISRDEHRKSIRRGMSVRELRAMPSELVGESQSDSARPSDKVMRRARIRRRRPGLSGIQAPGDPQLVEEVLTVETHVESVRAHEIYRPVPQGEAADQ